MTIRRSPSSSGSAPSYPTFSSLPFQDSASSKGARLLIVDDDPAVSIDLQVRLQRLGYNVVGQASSVAEALSTTTRCPPELVLIDMGFAARTDLARQLFEQFDASIVYLGETGDPYTPEQAAGAASYAFLQRPLRDDTVRRIVESALRNRRHAFSLCSNHEHVVAPEAATEAREQVNEQLAAKTLELQHALHSKDSFVAGMSHELRTPLALILGYTDMLLMGLPGRLNSRQKKHLGTIQRNGEHLLSLINDLLDLAKLNAEPLDLLAEPVSCRQVLEETIASFEPLAAAKHLRLEAHTTEPRLTALADRRALQQVLFNLVGNALKFTDHGEVRVTCQRVMEAGRPAISWEVRDTGAGLSADEIKSLFRPFARTASARTSTRRGTGLGLHLSRRLVEQMNGSIRVESIQNVGSLFTLVLPASVPDDGYT